MEEKQPLKVGDRVEQMCVTCNEERGHIVASVSKTGRGKSLAVAAYVDYANGGGGTFNTPDVLLMDSTLFASGGSHEELGDTGLMLDYQEYRAGATPDEFLPDHVSSELLRLHDRVRKPPPRRPNQYLSNRHTRRPQGEQ